jgi:hypothetical protein
MPNEDNKESAMSEQHPEGLTERLAGAYNRMLERTREAMDKAGKGLREGVDTAMEKATELGELSREEADLVSIYVMRDLADAAEFVSEEGQELRDWLKFDLELVENSVLDIFAQMVDHTREELTKLELRATALGEWKSGEVTGIGTLQCKSCGELLHFHATGHIPPCPKCHGTTYRRLSTGEG